jgi:hypothetical protein
MKNPFRSRLANLFAIVSLFTAVCGIGITVAPGIADAQPGYACTQAVSQGPPVFIPNDGWYECVCWKDAYIVMCQWEKLPSNPDNTSTAGSHNESATKNSRKAVVKASVMRNGSSIWTKNHAISTSTGTSSPSTSCLSLYCTLPVPSTHLQTYTQLWRHDGTNWNVCGNYGWTASPNTTAKLSTTLNWGSACGDGTYGNWSGAAQWNGNDFNYAWTWSGTVGICSACKQTGDNPQIPPPPLPKVIKPKAAKHSGGSQAAEATESGIAKQQPDGPTPSVVPQPQNDGAVLTVVPSDTGSGL